MLREESEGLGERHGEKLEGIKETESGESKMGRDRQSKTKMEARRREKDKPPPKKRRRTGEGGSAGREKARRRELQQRQQFSSRVSRGKTSPLLHEGGFLPKAASAAPPVGPGGRRWQDGVLPLPPPAARFLAAVHYREDITACSPPLLIALLLWITSSLPPQRPFANHHLVIIIPDDKLLQLTLPRHKIPASHTLPWHGRISACRSVPGRKGWEGTKAGSGDE